MDFRLCLEVLELQGCKFVKIPYGLKSPKTSDWHKTYSSASDIDIGNENVGILLNESSNGIVAIDFDGSSSQAYFNSLFPDTTLPNTVAFTSTRLGRHQKLFKIDPKYFEYLSLKQLKTGVVDANGKHEQLELRFQYKKAAQSVLPNSTVIDDLGTRIYQYLEGSSPLDVEIATLPDAVLCYWLTLCNDLSEPEKVTIHHNDDMVVHLMETLKHYYSSLSYDEWIRVAWALKNSIGEYDAYSLMQYFYPEQEKGEYKKLMRSRPAGKQCTLGTIRYMIKSRGGVCANNQEEILLSAILNKRSH
jgi:hypothetical protein